MHVYREHPSQKVLKAPRGMPPHNIVKMLEQLKGRTDVMEGKDKPQEGQSDGNSVPESRGC